MKNRRIVIEELTYEELKKDLENLFSKFLKKEQDQIQRPKIKLLTIRETAEFFSVSTKTIQNWSRHQLLRPITVARRVYFQLDEIEELINKNKI